LRVRYSVWYQLHCSGQAERMDGMTIEQLYQWAVENKADKLVMIEIKYSKEQTDGNDD